MRKLISIIMVSIILFADFNLAYAGDGCRGRCSGNSSCSACKNCSGCKHCNSGGTCGVCSSGNTKPISKKYYKTSYSNNSVENNSVENNRKYTSSNKTTTDSSNDTYTTHFVRSQTLNIRKQPSTSAIILCTLNIDDEVILIEKYSEKWAKVKVLCKNETIIGFVYSEYLSQ